MEKLTYFLFLMKPQRARISFLFPELKTDIQVVRGLFSTEPPLLEDIDTDVRGLDKTTTHIRIRGRHHLVLRNKKYKHSQRVSHIVA